MTTIKIKNGNDWENIALANYPVGSVYISYSSTSPATLFGGTWVQMTSGVLRMANDTNTGGSDSFTIGTANLPKHTHSVGAHKHTVPAHGHANTISYSVNSSGAVTNGISGGKHTHTIKFNNCASGSGAGSPAGNGFAEYNNFYSTDGSHTHNLPNHTHTLTKSGSVTDKAAFDTNNSTAFNTSDGNFSNTAISNLPVYQDLYAWRRTA